MKLVILFSFIFSLNVFANSSQERYLEAEKRVLNKRKVKVIKKVSAKLVMPYEVIEKSLNFATTQSRINVSGYTEGVPGVCEIKGSIELTKTNVIATCITSSTLCTLRSLCSLSSLSTL